jgi:hypothetical protein
MVMRAATTTTRVSRSGFITKLGFKDVELSVRRGERDRGELPPAPREHMVTASEECIAGRDWSVFATVTERTGHRGMERTLQRLA